MNLNHSPYKKGITNIRFLFIITFLLVFPVTLVFAQNQTVTVTGKNLSLLKAFGAIEKQTQLSIAYNQTQLDVKHLVNANYTSQKLSFVLDQLLKGIQYSYKIDGNYIIIVPAKESKEVQQVGKQKQKIHGVVLDANKEPIIGASVIEKGTSNGTITDLDGNFELALDNDQTMVQVSYIGYQPQDLKAVSGKPMSILMKEDTQLLEEVVVVGYGTQKKVNLTGAVTAVSGTEMTKRPVMNAANMLQGHVPGLSVVQQSGQPGAENATFRVRGQGTYSDAGSNPLILINGVPGSLTNLDPSIIESVSVLKDAASASIYGSRAANGVVLVTTKKGADGGKKFTATYSGNFAIYNPTKMLNTVTNSAEYMDLFNLAKKNSGKAGVYDPAEIEKYRNSNGSIEYPSFDWVDYMFEPAFVQNHNLALSGSSEKSTYNITLNFADQPGTMKGFSYKKYNFSTDISSQLTGWLKVGAYVSANYNQREEPRNGAGDAFICTLAQAPTSMPWLPDDGTGIRRYTFGAYPDIEPTNKNMQAMIDNGIMKNANTYDLNGQFYIELIPLKGLKWHTKIAARLYDEKTKDWSGKPVPTYNYHTGEIVRNMDLIGGSLPGLSVSDDQTLYTNLYSFLEYKIPFANRDHNLTAMVGYNQEMNTRDVLSAKRIDYQFDLPEIDAGSMEKRENGGYKEQWALMSGFFRANYDYKGIYLAEVNARYDGTSRIASDSRWGLFPSFSLGYRITEEKFMKNLGLSWLNNVKIRGSWGQLGNQNIGLYPYQAVMDLADSYSFDNSTLTQGVVQKKYVNRDLKWETTTITDIGADITLFNRLNIVFDWYSKNTTDILRTAQISDFVGLEAPYVNDGEMLNKGIEIAVNWNDYIKGGVFKGMQYNAGFYIDRSINELTKFGADEKDDHSIRREGLPYNSYYMLDAIGVFADQAEIDAAPKQFSDDTRPGDIRYRDADGNGVIDSDDRVVMDGRFPKFEYSFSGGLSWKGFDLTLFFQGVAGRSTYVGTGAGITPFAQGAFINKDYISGMWTEENPNGAVNPRLYYEDMGGNRNRRANSYYLRDASYLRLKNLTFGYTFPKIWTRKAAIENLRVFFSGDNLLTFTGYEGLDPENNLDGSFLSYPQNKIFSFGINVEF